MPPRHAPAALRLSTKRFHDHLRAAGSKAVTEVSPGYWYDDVKKERAPNPNKREDPKQQRRPKSEQMARRSARNTDDAGKLQRMADGVSRGGFDDAKVAAIASKLGLPEGASREQVTAALEKRAGSRTARAGRLGNEADEFRKQEAATAKALEEAAAGDPDDPATKDAKKVLTAAGEMWKKAKSAWDWVGGVVQKAVDAANEVTVGAASRALDWVNRAVKKGGPQPKGPKGRPEDFEFRNTVWEQTGQTRDQDGAQWSEYKDVVNDKILWMNDAGKIDGDIYPSLTVNDLFMWTTRMMTKMAGGTGGDTGEAAEDQAQEQTGLPGIQNVLGLVARGLTWLWFKARGKETTGERQKREAREKRDANRAGRQKRLPRAFRKSFETPKADDGMRDVKRKVAVSLGHSTLEAMFKAAGGTGFPKEMLEQAADAWLDEEYGPRGGRHAENPPEPPPSRLSGPASPSRFDKHLRSQGVISVRRQGIAYAVKDIVERSPNYWINTETGRRVPNPNKQPKDSLKKRPRKIPSSYNREGTPTNDDREGAVNNEQPTTTQQRERLAPKPPKKEEEPKKPRNPKFENIDASIGMLELGVGLDGAPDELAMSALADMQEEGTDIPGANFNIRERIRNDGSERGAARAILWNVFKSVGKTARIKKILGITASQTNKWLEEGLVPSLQWNNESDYRIGRVLEALGWKVEWQGKGAPPTDKKDDRVYSGAVVDVAAPGFTPTYRPKGSVPILRSAGGHVHTAVKPSAEAFQRLKPTLQRAFQEAMNYREADDLGHVRSSLLMREVLRIDPGVNPADVWAAVREMARLRMTQFADQGREDADREMAAGPGGLGGEDGSLWNAGRPQYVMTSHLDRTDFFGPP